MRRFLVKSMSFIAGATPASANLSLSPTPVTVFVGPNNSGKSCALREIEMLTKQSTKRGACVVASVNLELAKAASDLLRELEEDACQVTPQAFAYVGVPGQESTLTVDPIAIEKNFANKDFIRGQIGSVYTMRLDGSTRLRLTGMQPAGDLLSPARNHLLRLFQDSPRRAELKTLVLDAFGSHLVIDPTNIGHLRLRLSTRPPTNEAEEQGWDQRSRDFHGAATPIDDMSDGVKAYTGILAAVLSSHRKVILLDEPEAFLHPPLARKLGRNLARIAREAMKNLFVATHSSQFLLGCVESGVATSVVRLTYSAGQATARYLHSDRLLELMRDPLLRSSSVVSALFHAGAVVAEGDVDRAFYDEINSRLLNAPAPSGAFDSIFLNAQNKQTVRRIIGPLRSLGIPVAGIVDLDIIKDGGIEWTDLLHSAGVPRPIHGSLATLRASIKSLFESRGVDPKRVGVQALDKAGQESCRSLLTQLAEYGVFVVSSGEIEKWLPQLGITGKGPAWLEKMFVAMGSDPQHAQYCHPSADDVWEFLRKVGAWIADPQRKGMPAE